MKRKESKKQVKSSASTQKGTTESDEKLLLDSWQPSIHNAISNLWSRFSNNKKFILTESDLKCWLFLELQRQKPYTPYAVHTEVTHKHDLPEGSKKKGDYSFRDLSLLCPWEIKANEELLNQLEKGEKLLSKGFRHRAPAIHFELKLIRVAYPLNRIKEDIDKLNNYEKGRKAKRRFTIVCGSSDVHVNCNQVLSALRDYLKDFKNAQLKPLVDFYLFDQHSLLYISFDEKGKLKESLLLNNSQQAS